MEVDNKPLNVYAAYYDNIVRDVSSSGGVFSVIAREFDIVYGTAMTEDCYSAKIVRITDDFSCLRGSKYLQSDVGDMFRSVERDLLNGYSVLFSGTGCQINGLKCFLGTNYDKLLCVDVICHGVPSPVLWEKYAKYREHINGKIVHVNFRCKEINWHRFGIKENKRFIPARKDPFMNMFLNNNCLRPSCYECRAKDNKMADVTIGDFWGIEKIAPKMDDNNGTSLVIVRTEKGANLFEKIKDKLIYLDVKYEDSVRDNPAEYKSVDRPKCRDAFLKDMRYMSFARLKWKYIYLPAVKRAFCSIKRIIAGGVKDKGIEYGLLFCFDDAKERL